MSFKRLYGIFVIYVYLTPILFLRLIFKESEFLSFDLLMSTFSYLLLLLVVVVVCDVCMNAACVWMHMCQGVHVEGRGHRFWKFVLSVFCGFWLVSFLNVFILRTFLLALPSLKDTGVKCIRRAQTLSFQVSWILVL